ncbi:MAG: hypothetical protein KJ070_21310 [Verrucomicrobia bacterium]|nr:hypothetical protein [Verrucomicrobiota bacterium]
MKNLEQKQLRNAWTAKRFVAILLLAQFLFVLAMTQCESFHKALHPDAGKPNHHCAVTMLQSGQVDTPSCGVAIVPTVALPITLVVVEPFFVPSVDYFLLPSCGPPALLS